MSIKINEKAQSAMEFLITYGWAVLIMLAVIGILFYLGVFNPKTVAPSGCVLPAGFSCSGFKIHGSGELVLDLVQNTGHTLYIKKIACSDEETPGNYDDVNERVYNGEKLRITTTCYKSNGNPPEEGEYFKGTIYLVYTDEDTNIEHKITGEIAYRVEEST